jgi:membrane-bound serine protease (ClpP class)
MVNEVMNRIEPRLARTMAVALALCMVLGAFIGMATGVAKASDAKPLVYVIPIEQTIESGLESFLERGIMEAEETGADHIVFTIDTLGGAITAAIEIGEIIRDSKIPTVAYVHGKAISAGSYISMNAEQIVMAPGSSIGAAAIVDLNGNRVTDSKTIAVWVAQMEAAAELRDRNTTYAAGMVDDTLVVEVPEINKTFDKGTLISFSHEQALAAGYAESIQSDLSGVLQFIGMPDAEVIHFEPTISEKIARWLTNPVIMTILLLLGLGGVMIELFAPGFGVPGIIGVSAFILYFFGHFVAGFAGIEHIILFVAGIILLFLEIFIPSFGILGVSGLISLSSGIVLAAYDSGQALTSLGIAFLGTLVIFVVFFRFFKSRGVWNKFILRDEFKTESGYTSSTPKQHLVGKEGKALSVLRPSGVAIIEDQRVDVVTSGEYIQSGQTVKVIQVEGTRVVVREVTE